MYLLFLINYKTTLFIIKINMYNYIIIVEGGYMDGGKISELRLACEEGETEKIRILLSENPEVDTPMRIPVTIENLEPGMKPLHFKLNSLLAYACYQNKLEIAKLLIEAGANTYMQTDIGPFLLLLASKPGNEGLHAMQLLLDHNAPIDGVDIGRAILGDEKGIEAVSALLFGALQSKNGEIVKLLHRNGLSCDPNIVKDYIEPDMVELLMNLTR